MNTPTDLVVVLPGILGSTLRHHDHFVWAPSAGSALRAIATFGRCLRVLQLPHDIGDDHPNDGVEPVALMPDLHVIPGIWTPIKGYDRLLTRLRSLGYREPAGAPDAPPGNLLPIAYDWRLSNRYNGQRLARIVEPALERWRQQGGRYAEAKVNFICHSMGGLVARWYIEQCGGAEISHKLITFGTPFRGAAKALEQLVNGVHKGLGALSVDLTSFTRSMPSMYQLLPEYACIEQHTNLAKTIEVMIPELRHPDIANGMQFHSQLAEAETRRPGVSTSTHAIVGIQQPTATTARISHGRIELVNTYRAENLYGDATVPIVGACRPDVSMDSPLLRRIPDQHGNLQRNGAALDELEGILTASAITVRGPHTIDLHAELPDLIFAGEPLTIHIATADDKHHPLCITINDEGGHLIDSRATNSPVVTIQIEDLPPGAYSIYITGIGSNAPISPISSDVLVWG